MNNNSPYICFIGLSEDGELSMFITEYGLSPLGSRLLKPGQRFPDPVLDLYSGEELSREAIIRALESATAFLNNEQDSHATPVFGEAPDKPKRKKA